MMKDDNVIFVMFVGCFAALIMLVLHFNQQNKLVELQTQIDELKIIVDQKFLPALMLDKEVFHIR
jgi:hypothetical protein